VGPFIESFVSSAWQEDLFCWVYERAAKGFLAQRLRCGEVVGVKSSLDTERSRMACLGGMSGREKGRGEWFTGEVMRVALPPRGAFGARCFEERSRASEGGKGGGEADSK